MGYVLGHISRARAFRRRPGFRDISAKARGNDSSSGLLRYKVEFLRKGFLGTSNATENSAISQNGFSDISA